MAGSSIKLDQLNNTLGAYCRENKDVLISEIVLDPKSEERFQVYDDIKDEYPLPFVNIAEDLVKPGNSRKFEPTEDALNFDARILKVRDCKIDLQIFPQDFEKTYLGKYKQKGSRQQDIPFEAFLFSQIILKARKAMHTKAFYSGVYNATGSRTVDTMDGFSTILKKEVLAGKIIPIVTGVITPANVIDKILMVYDSLGEDYKAENAQVKISSTLFDWAHRKFNPITNPSLVGTDTLANGKIPRINYLPLPGTNGTLVREEGLGNSQQIICTPKQNMGYGTDSLNDINNVEVQREKRALNILIDFKAGVEFSEIHARALAINEL